LLPCMMMIPFVSMPFELNALICSEGMSDPTAATIEVGANMLDDIEAKVAAPPSIRVSVRKGVRVVSSATVPKTVSNAYLVANIVSLLNACRHH
jgi:hypothetical protein